MTVFSFSVPWPWLKVYNVIVRDALEWRSKPGSTDETVTCINMDVRIRKRKLSLPCLSLLCSVN